MKQAGFTLLELMVAAALAAIVATGLYATYGAVLGVAEAVEHTRLTQSGRILLERLSDDLAGIYFPHTQAKEQEDYRFALGGERREDEDTSGRAPDLERNRTPGTVVLDMVVADGLDFEGAFPEQGLWRVRYILRQTGWREDRYLLVRQDKPMARIQEEELAWRELELASMVGSWELRCVAEDGMELDEWDSASNAEGQVLRLPKRVLLEFALLQDGRERAFTTHMELPWRPRDVD